jgi:segregation and condensation protein A
LSGVEKALSQAGADEPVQGKEGDPVADPGSAGQASVAHPAQAEMPFAIVNGRAFTDLPKDLYIPPDALEVILESFEGPLDLLLYLIRRQNLDILEVDVSEITKQYVAYVEMMEAMQFELAAEYLVMAAMLAEIKSRMLLPRSSISEDEEEEDPRAMLIRRLQEYERFKEAAESIDELPRVHRDTYIGRAQGPDRALTRPDPEVDLKELLLALSEVFRRADMFESHHVEKERLSTRERMTQVLDKLRGQQFVPFVSLFTVNEGRLGVVVTFLAVMELIKESLVEIVQAEAFGPIHVKARS